MARGSSIGGILSCAAILTLISAPGLTTAAEKLPTAAGAGVVQAIRVTDVALDASGALSGQVVTAQGAQASNVVVLVDNGRQQWKTTTDAQGQFRFEALSPGGYRLQSGGQVQFCRAWKAGTAPPAANQGLLVVQSGQTILGQYCGSPVGCGSPVCGGWTGCHDLLTSPLVLGGVIAAAIAIPIAVNNAGDDDPEA